MKQYKSLALITLLLFIFFNHFCSAQEAPPVTWGQIPRSDLEMKTFPKDSNATALILCDYGEFSVDRDFHVSRFKHLRVKILTAAGYSWGTHSVILETKESDSKIKDIEGATYWIDQKGNITKQELSSKDIFEEDQNGEMKRYRFTLPSLKPGCVIEIRYRIDTKNPLLSWKFQYDEPVRWSEFRVRYPRSCSYINVKKGYEPFIIDGDLEEVHDDDFGYCTQLRWAIQDAPAIREEPYITTTDDYVNKVELQPPLYNNLRPIDHWNSLIEKLLNLEEFCGRIGVTPLISKMAEEITRNLTSREDKIKAIYDWVSRSIICSNRNSVFSGQEVDDVIESKKGSNSDITFLLLSLLKSVGIDGDPVILSTRDHGKLQDGYPIIEQFNYVLARVYMEGKSYFLDATDPMRSFDMLPSQVLNVRALVIVKTMPPEWVTLTADKYYLTNSITKIKLRKDCSLQGTVDEFLSGYGALIVRGGLKIKKDMDYAKGLYKTDKSGISIDTLTVSGRDSINQSIRIKASISSSDYALGNGNNIYFNPYVINRVSENPFKARERKYPIDFSYRLSTKNYISITIPDSFEVKDTLRTVSFSAALGNLLFTRNVKVEKNTIDIFNQLEVKATQIDPKYYEQIREFYSRLVALNSEQLVLSQVKNADEKMQQPSVSVQTANQESINSKSVKKNIKGRLKR